MNDNLLERLLQMMQAYQKTLDALEASINEIKARL